MSFIGDLKRGAEEGWDRAIDILRGEDFLDVLAKTKKNLEDDQDEQDEDL